MHLVLKGNHEMLHSETQMSIPHKYEQDCTAPDTVGQTPRHRAQTSTSIQSWPQISGVLHFATARPRTSSSALLHDGLRSGTKKSMDSSARHVRICRMVCHPSTGRNLLMSGVDLLNGATGTPAVLQESVTQEDIQYCVFICNRIKKGEDQG